MEACREWNANEEKLLCHVLLDDAIAKRLRLTDGKPYFRAFLVKNRKSGEVVLKYRFLYADDRRSWFHVRDKNNDGDKLLKVLETTIKTAMSEWGATTEEVESGLQFFYPPDDMGEPIRTLLWLEEKDLIELKHAEGNPENGRQN